MKPLTYKFDFTPLSKEQRFVISAYTGCFMILEHEYNDFYQFMEQTTGIRVGGYFALLDPTIWLVARNKVSADFMRLMADKETIEANRQAEVSTLDLQDLKEPERLTDIPDEALSDIAARSPKTAKEWIKFAKKQRNE